MTDWTGWNDCFVDCKDFNQGGEYMNTVKFINLRLSKSDLRGTHWPSG